MLYVNLLLTYFNKALTKSLFMGESESPVLLLGTGLLNLNIFLIRMVDHHHPEQH